MQLDGNAKSLTICALDSDPDSSTFFPFVTDTEVTFDGHCPVCPACPIAPPADPDAPLDGVDDDDPVDPIDPLLLPAPGCVCAPEPHWSSLVPVPVEPVEGTFCCC